MIVGISNNKSSSIRLLPTKFILGNKNGMDLVLVQTIIPNKILTVNMFVVTQEAGNASNQI